MSRKKKKQRTIMRQIYEVPKELGKADDQFEAAAGRVFKAPVTSWKRIYDEGLVNGTIDNTYRAAKGLTKGAARAFEEAGKTIGIAGSRILLGKRGYKDVRNMYDPSAPGPTLGFNTKPVPRMTNKETAIVGDNTGNIPGLLANYSANQGDRTLRGIPSGQLIDANRLGPVRTQPQDTVLPGVNDDTGQTIPDVNRTAVRTSDDLASVTRPTVNNAPVKQNGHIQLDPNSVYTPKFDGDYIARAGNNFATNMPTLPEEGVNRGFKRVFPDGSNEVVPEDRGLISAGDQPLRRTPEQQAWLDRQNLMQNMTNEDKRRFILGERASKAERAERQKDRDLALQISRNAATQAENKTQGKKPVIKYGTMKDASGNQTTYISEMPIDEYHKIQKKAGSKPTAYQKRVLELYRPDSQGVIGEFVGADDKALSELDTLWLQEHPNGDLKNAFHRGGDVFGVTNGNKTKVKESVDTIFKKVRSDPRYKNMTDSELKEAIRRSQNQA